MSTLRNPVGPQSSKVYWRRRLVFIVALVAVIVVVILIVTRLGAGAAPQNTADAAAGASPSTEPSPSADAPSVDAPVAGADCAPASVKLDAVADRNSYPAGESPLLSFTVTNTGPVSCTLNVGSTQQVFTVTSGAEVYWSSTDCLTDPVDAPLLLEPNVAVTSTPIAWDRTRSAPSTCGGERQAVPAGGATFNLGVALGAIEAAPVSFLLN